MRLRLPIILCLSTALSTTVAHADIPLLRDRDPSERPSLVVIGVSHFGNPQGDQVNVKMDDVLAPRRQREIEAVVDVLATYRPTHVVVEFPGYARNLRILANLVRIAPESGDRIVAIYGAGHKPLLDRYAAESLAFEVDDARGVLQCR